MVLPRSDAELVSAFFNALCERRGGDAIALINRLVEDGVDLVQFTNDAIEFAREALIATFGATSEASPANLPKNLSAVHIIRIINSLLVARNELKSTPIPQLPLEIVAAEHCTEPGTSPVARSTSPAEPGTLPVARSTSSAEVSPRPPQATSDAPRAARQFTTPIETVILRWDELCISVQEENPSLPFLLRVARPLRVEDGVLVIGVQYKMHAEKLNSAKNINSIVRGLTALYGNDNIAVRAEIAPEQSGDGALTNSLISEFGGAAVE